MSDKLVIADKTFDSRLFIGSARYPSQRVMLEAIDASGAEVVTVALRRVSIHGGGESAAAAARTTAAARELVTCFMDAATFLTVMKACLRKAFAPTSRFNEPD